MTLKQSSSKILFFWARDTKNTVVICLGYLVIVAITLISLSVELGAQEGKIFTVSNVHVDVTSSSSADARTKAIADGQRRAFQLLLRRLVKFDEIGQLPIMSSQEIDQYVRDFAVNNEKNSPIRYLADLTFSFKARKVRTLLRDLEVEFAETVRKPVLVLPIYDVAAAKLLWETPNPWRKAWIGLKLPVGLVPFRLPFGDLKDISKIGAEQAMSGDEPRIRAIATRYNVETVMVVRGALTTGPKGQPAISVDVISYGLYRIASLKEQKYLLEPGETVGGMLMRVAISTRNKIEDTWKEDNLIKFEQGSVLAASVPILSLTDWVEARRRLADVAIIERIELVLISRNEALINIFYLGGDEQLSLAFAQADMRLEEEEGSWTLKFWRVSKELNTIKAK